MSFSDTSRYIHLERDTVLVARCQKIDGSERQSRLDLSKHIGNKEGAFDLDGKNFNSSARRVRLEDRLLCADLKSSNGHWYQASINLNAFIENKDGTLVFRNRVDQNVVHRPGWKPPATIGQQRHEKDENVTAPAVQCELCEDWPYVHFWTRTPKSPKLNLVNLKSRKRKRDCPTCTLAERVIYELVPRLAEPRKVKVDSIMLELRAQPKDFPLLKIKFENTLGEQYETEGMVHTVDDKANLSKFYANVPCAKLLSGSSTSPKSVSLAKKWLKSCVEKHEKCKKERKTPLPARILDVGTKSGDFVRLKTSSGEQETYACLSHCWGLTKSLTLTEKNHDDLHKRIDWDALPKVYTDAITICRSLGIQYIWVDALCIVQDSTDDWKRESSKMYSYYGECYVCIAATSAGNHDGNCSVRNLTLKHEGQGPDGLHYSVYVRPEVPHIMHAGKFPHAKYFPLLERAWVYQERRLSPRVLHITDMEMFFECNATMSCECGGTPHIYSVSSWTKAQESFYATHKDVSDIEESPFKVEHEWRSFVHAYSKLKLTKQSDRLPALSGLARYSIHRRGAHDSMTGRYLAGCWENSLINDMAWAVGPQLNRVKRHGSDGFSLPSLFPDTHTYAKQPKPHGYIAPSWSWASITDQVKYAPFGYPDHLCKIEEAHVDLLTQDQFGQVEGGWLILSAKVIPSRWMWQKNWTGGYASLQDIASTSRFWGLKKDKGMKWWRDWADGEHQQLDPKSDLYLMPLAARKLLGKTESAEFNFKLNPGWTVTETVYLVLRKVDIKAQPMVYERVGWASRSGASEKSNLDGVELVKLKLI